MVWESLLAGVAVTVLFSLVIVGWARGAEARRDGHGAAATAYAGLAVLALAVFAAAVVLAVTVMLNKS